MWFAEECTTSQYTAPCRSVSAMFWGSPAWTSCLCRLSWSWLDSRFSRNEAFLERVRRSLICRSLLNQLPWSVLLKKSRQVGPKYLYSITTNKRKRSGYRIGRVWVEFWVSKLNPWMYTSAFKEIRYINVNFCIYMHGDVLMLMVVQFKSKTGNKLNCFHQHATFTSYVFYSTLAIMPDDSPLRY